MQHTLSKCQDPVSVAGFLKTAARSHKRHTGQWYWNEYNSKVRYAWISSYYRFFGIDATPPKITLAEGELLIPVPLPWTGCGRDVIELVSRCVQRNNRRRASTPARCGRPPVTF
jgi:hypothetical protein